MRQSGNPSQGKRVGQAMFDLGIFVQIKYGSCTQKTKMAKTLYACDGTWSLPDTTGQFLATTSCPTSDCLAIHELQQKFDDCSPCTFFRKKTPSLALLPNHSTSTEDQTPPRRRCSQSEMLSRAQSCRKPRRLPAPSRQTEMASCLPGSRLGKRPTDQPRPV